MTLRVGAVCIDAVDPVGLGDFWCGVLGGTTEVDDDGDVAVHPASATGCPVVLLLAVPESKATKNRVHLDLVPDNQSAEVDRLLALGATRASVGQADDVPWVVLADPEGNEFCVLGADEG